MGIVEYICLGLLLLMVFVLIFNSIYIRTPRHLNQVRPIEKFRQGVPNNLDIMNTGSNHAYYSIDWSIVGVNGFSLASGPQSLSWDYRLVNKYRSHIKKEKILLIVLSDLVFGFLEYPQDRANLRYYYFVKNEDIPNSTWWKKIKYRYLPVLENWRNFVHCFYHRGKLFQENEPSLAYAEKSSEERINGWKVQFNLKDLQHRESLEHLQGNIQKASQLLKRLIEETQASGIIPILMLPPVSSVLNSKISDEFINEVILKPVANVAPDVPLLNYMRDVRFQDYRYYYNGDFMNQAGREKFMPILWQDIQKTVGEKQQ